MRYLWSRLWDSYTPARLWEHCFGRLAPEWLERVECQICEMFPDSWYDQND